MTMPAMMKAMMGDFSLDIPCVICTAGGVEEPEQGKTLVAGTVVCPTHVELALDMFHGVDAKALKAIL